MGCPERAGSSFFNLLDRLRATVFRSLQARVPPPPCDFHLRFWGCKWCGRVPTADPLMGFWEGQDGVHPFVDRGLLVFGVHLDSPKISAPRHRVIDDPCRVIPQPARFGRASDPPFDDRSDSD